MSGERIAEYIWNTATADGFVPQMADPAFWEERAKLIYQGRFVFPSKFSKMLAARAEGAIDLPTPAAKKKLKHRVERTKHVEETEIVEDGDKDGDDDPDRYNPEDEEEGEEEGEEEDELDELVADSEDEEEEELEAVAARHQLAGLTHAVLGEKAARRIARLHRKVTAEAVKSQAVQAARQIRAMRGETLAPVIESPKPHASFRSLGGRVVNGKYVIGA
jgi:hypothetical protein